MQSSIGYHRPGILSSREIDLPQSVPENTMIHHKDPYLVIRCLDNKNIGCYGVSKDFRVLSPGLLLKHWDKVIQLLKEVLQLTTAEREVAIRLLRLWVYYGKVYPAEKQITALPGCSKATFWRTVRKLREMHLIEVINRFVLREKAQISNLYRLNNLVLAIARYLMEHNIPIPHYAGKGVFALPGSVFWTKIYQVLFFLPGEVN